MTHIPEIGSENQSKRNASYYFLYVYHAGEVILSYAAGIECIFSATFWDLLCEREQNVLVKHGLGFCELFCIVFNQVSLC